jgi:hypothetical protein
MRRRPKAPPDLIEILLWTVMVIATVLMGVFAILPVWDITRWA